MQVALVEMQQAAHDLQQVKNAGKVPPQLPQFFVGAEAEAALAAEAKALEAVTLEGSAEPAEEAVVLEAAEAVETQPEAEVAAPEAEPVLPIEAVSFALEGVDAVAEAAVATEEEEDTSLDKLFTLTPEALVAPETLDEEEEDETGDKKKKKKKKKFVEVEYDPDADFLVVTKKRKRGDTEW